MNYPFLEPKKIIKQKETLNCLAFLQIARNTSGESGNENLRRRPTLNQGRVLRSNPLRTSNGPVAHGIRWQEKCADIQKEPMRWAEREVRKRGEGGAVSVGAGPLGRRRSLGGGAALAQCPDQASFQDRGGGPAGTHPRGVGGTPSKKKQKRGLKTISAKKKTQPVFFPTFGRTQRS